MSERDDLVMHSQAKVIDLHNQKPNLFLPDDLVLYNLSHIDYLFSELNCSEFDKNHHIRPKISDSSLDSLATIPTKIDLDQNLSKTSSVGDAHDYRKPPDKPKFNLDTWMYGANWNNTPMRELNHLTPNEVCLSVIPPMMS